MTYFPPRKDLPSHLQDCPVHRWRAETGIELIHQEPTQSELDRIWSNWNLMTDEQKLISDAQSRKFWGIDNQEHYYHLTKEASCSD